jgi:hypothetical protein
MGKGSGCRQRNACQTGTAAVGFRAVNWYDWLLFLHVTAAFLTVAAVALYVAIFLAVRRFTASTPVARLAPVAAVLWAIGGLSVIVFGIWLAIYVDAYQVWDGWLLAAIVLWAVASASGGQISKGYARDSAAPLPESRALVLHVVLVVTVLALLVDMIYKPGAG